MVLQTQPRTYNILYLFIFIYNKHRWTYFNLVFFKGCPVISYKQRETYNAITWGTSASWKRMSYIQDLFRSFAKWKQIFSNQNLDLNWFWYDMEVHQFPTISVGLNEICMCRLINKMTFSVIKKKLASYCMYSSKDSCQGIRRKQTLLRRLQSQPSFQTRWQLEWAILNENVRKARHKKIALGNCVNYFSISVVSETFTTGMLLHYLD